VWHVSSVCLLIVLSMRLHDQSYTGIILRCQSDPPINISINKYSAPSDLDAVTRAVKYGNHQITGHGSAAYQLAPFTFLGFFG